MARGQEMSASRIVTHLLEDPMGATLRGRRRMLGALLVAVLGVILPGQVAGQGLDAVKASYTKYEYRIPMRDGKRLFTAVYVPKDQAEPYPILLLRTPYSVAPYGVDKYPDNLGPSPLFGKAG